ncbi:MAG: metallopeptidase [Patescibacteria group bacterium]|nr:metallopeptidase [Patescibacteria group bacterium]
MDWEEAKDVEQKIKLILYHLDMPHVVQSRIFCYRTHGSKSRAYARIWTFPKIFQQALNIEASYVIEVLSKYYDKLNEKDQHKVLIHELLHIPKNFSGALLPHRSRGRHLGKQVNILFEEFKKKIDL